MLAIPEESSPTSMRLVRTGDFGKRSGCGGYPEKAPAQDPEAIGRGTAAALTGNKQNVALRGGEGEAHHHRLHAQVPDRLLDNVPFDNGPLARAPLHQKTGL